VRDLNTFFGACDASGVVALDGESFASGTDEANRISIHRRDGDRLPLSSVTLDGFLGAKWRKKKESFAECDIERATRLGDLTLWITSHGRNKKEDEKPERHRLFALQIHGSGDAIRLEPYGVPYRNLLQDLLAAPFPEHWPLQKASTRAPRSKGGLNIEGICATPQGSLWIGFRNPIPHKHAILAELLNPLEIVAPGKGSAKFGRFLSLDLGGRGIRDLIAHGDGYLILAGAHDDRGNFALFQWDGEDQTPLQLPLDPAAGQMNPEGLLIFPGDPDRIHIFSDDDSLQFGGVPNSELPAHQQSFRSTVIEWNTCKGA